MDNWGEDLIFDIKSKQLRSKFQKNYNKHFTIYYLFYLYEKTHLKLLKELFVFPRTKLKRFTEIN